MSETRDVSTEQTGQEARPPQEAQQMDYPIRPPVDIFEDEGGITVLADMPGVSRERLEVNIDSDSLTIEGTADIRMPEGMQALYADVPSTRYQRSFSLSRELDGENVSASLKDGVLTLRIPKRAEHRPRRIDIQTA